MDRFNWPCNNTNDHYDLYYNQAHQEDGQHSSQSETGQTSGGGAASGPSWSHPAPGQPQPYPGFNLPAQIPPSPGPDWEYFLRTPQPMTLEEIIPSQMHLEDGQHTFQPETGQTSAGVAASGSYPAPDQPQPYQDLNPPAQISSWPRPDWGTSQPTTVADISQHDALPESSNPKPAAPARRGKLRARGLPPVKERFLAGLEAFGRGVPLKNCSSSLRFYEYIHNNGCMIRKGLALYNQLTEAEKTRLNQAIIARQGAKVIRLADENTVKERFLAGLDNYAQGARLVDCSATLQFKHYVTDSGFLRQAGKEVCKGLPPEALAWVNQALFRRREFCLKREKANASVEERFLASLDNYAQGVPLANCSTVLQVDVYVTSDGKLHTKGEALRKSLSAEDQARLNQALLRRRDIYLMNKASVEERFLASLESYAQGVLLKNCSEVLPVSDYVSHDGKLHPKGEALRDRLSQEDQALVDQALTARGRLFGQRATRYVSKFMATLEPYANGLSLQECGTLSGLKRKAKLYLTPEGGLTHKGKLLVENLHPGLMNRVFDAIGKRQRRTELNPQVPEPQRQWPEMLSPMPEMETAMVDPMQTEAMWASVWQLTGQAVPGSSGRRTSDTLFLNP
jgi:hypothetical protein